MVRNEVSLVPIEAGPKDFATARALLTVSDALAAAVFAPAFAVVSAPIAIELLWAPPAALVTFPVPVQEPPAGIVPPLKATLVPLLAAVTVPPTQVVAPPAAAVFTSPAG